MLRKNPFVHTFHKDKNVALFNALTLSTIYLTKTQHEATVKSPPRSFVEEEFFVSEDFNAVEYLQEFSKKKLNEANEINSAFFLVTTGCNLRCEYCFESSDVKNQQLHMSEEIAEKGVNLLARNAEKIGINFFGGEPLLNLKAIKKIIETTKKLSLDCKFKLITNGSLINDEISDFFKENNIYVAISIDGDKEINDKARKDAKGRGVSEKTLKGMEILNEKQVPFGVSSTIGNHNYDRLDSISMILEKFNVKDVGFSHVIENTGMKIHNETSSQILKNIIETAEKLLDKGIVENKMVNKALKPFIKGQNRLRECAAYGEQIVIAPNGAVGPCPRNFWSNKETNTYFDIDVDYVGNVKEHPTWIEWSNRTPLNMPQCWNCLAIGLCGGGCAGNNLISKKGMWDVNKVSCTLTKEVISWAIWKYYELKIQLAKSREQAAHVT